MVGWRPCRADFAGRPGCEDDLSVWLRVERQGEITFVMRIRPPDAPDGPYVDVTLTPLPGSLSSLPLEFATDDPLIAARRIWQSLPTEYVV